MTAGEGGMVITNELSCYEALQSIINCGRPSLTDQFEIKVLGANYRMTELQAALLIGQLEMWPEFCEQRTRNAALLSKALAALPQVRPLPPQAGLTRETIYNYVFQYRPTEPAPSRDLFVAALDAEGIPCDGRFYEPVYRSDLFYAKPENCPQLVLNRERADGLQQMLLPGVRARLLSGGRVVAAVPAARGRFGRAGYHPRHRESDWRPPQNSPRPTRNSPASKPAAARSGPRWSG